MYLYQMGSTHNSSRTWAELAKFISALKDKYQNV